ncbi:MAG: hypothetical protein WDN06_00440 [Asticcacaulis sp.]
MSCLSAWKTCTPPTTTVSALTANAFWPALDAQPVPETYADILRAARALIAVKKALDLLYKETPEVEAKARPCREKAAPATTAEPAEEDDEDPPVLKPPDAAHGRSPGAQGGQGRLLPPPRQRIGLHTF